MADGAESELRRMLRDVGVYGIEFLRMDGTVRASVGRPLTTVQEGRRLAGLFEAPADAIAEGITVGGVHYTAAGNALLAAAVYDAVKAWSMVYRTQAVAATRAMWLEQTAPWALRAPAMTDFRKGQSGGGVVGHQLREYQRHQIHARQHAPRTEVVKRRDQVGRDRLRGAGGL